MLQSPFRARGGGCRGMLFLDRDVGSSALEDQVLDWLVEFEWLI
jgi:hypothetical protein